MWKRIGTLAGATGAVILALLANACSDKSSCPNCFQGSESTGGDGGASSSGGSLGTPDSVTCIGPASASDAGGSSMLCPTASPLCCGTVQLGGSATNCAFGNVSTTCSTSCAVNQPLTCPGTDTLELCVATSDCVDPNYPKCCHVSTNAGEQGFCFSAANAAKLPDAGASCL